MNLTHHLVVDSEDGLLLLGDAAALQEWLGSDEEPTMLIAIGDAVAKGLPGINIPLLRESGVIWDMGGPGTADIFRDETGDHITLVRTWLSDADEEEAVRQLSAIPPKLESAFAEFHVDSEVLAIFSPTESGSCIVGEDDGSFSLLPDEMLSESSGLILGVANGRYQCFHDTIELGQNEAQRCHLIRMVTVTPSL